MNFSRHELHNRSPLPCVDEVPTTSREAFIYLDTDSRAKAGKVWPLNTPARSNTLARSQQDKTAPDIRLDFRQRTLQPENFHLKRPCQAFGGSLKAQDRYRVSADVLRSPLIERSCSDPNLMSLQSFSNESDSGYSDHIPLALDENNSCFNSTFLGNASEDRGRSGKRSQTPAEVFARTGECALSQESIFRDQKRSGSPLKRILGSNSNSAKAVSAKFSGDEMGIQGGSKVFGNFFRRGKGNSAVQGKNPFHRAPVSTSGATTSYASEVLQISLDPPNQARLYAELELMLCATANQYLAAQAQLKLLSNESIDDVMLNWRASNRPHILEYMFDQATQQELVQTNLKHFKFYGLHANDKNITLAILCAWKSLALEMKVRTFCLPDAVIKRQLFDMERILELLGAPLVTLAAFKNIQSQVEKIILQYNSGAGGKSSEPRSVGCAVPAHHLIPTASTGFF